MNIGFIGAGKVGFSMGKYLRQKFENAEGGFALAGYCSRHIGSAEEAASFTDSASFESMSGLVSVSDLVFLTVPDKEIKNVMAGILSEEADLQGKTFCHMSGSIGSEALLGACGRGAFVCSLHPLCAVADKFESYKSLDKAYFAFEGQEEAYAALLPLLDLLGNHVGRLSPQDKPLYHAACVFFSNLVCGVASIGEKLLSGCFDDVGFAENAWKALFIGNAENIINKGPVRALTGPLERGDLDTLLSHMAALRDDPEALSAYKAISLALTHTASEKHPGQDYAAIKKILSPEAARKQFIGVP